jgi:hypothetical protein
VSRFPASTIRAAAAILAVAVLVGACAKQEGKGEEVREHLTTTLREPHRFVYTETTPGGTTTVVQGLVEDDFRMKARLSLDDAPVLERIVDDDTVAVRFLQPELLGRFVDKEIVSSIDPATDRQGTDVFAALQSRRWVVDPGGAPVLLQSVDDQTEVGVDPIFDARRLLDRARSLTLLRSGGFVEFSHNTISPVYRRDEDPFPLPEEGSDVVRYDLPQPPFPRVTQGTQLAVPGEETFRKFSVYVKDGRVIKVSEHIGLSPSVLDDFRVFMVQLIQESAPPDVRDGFLDTLDSLEGDELGEFLLEGLNTIRDLQGDPPVRFRTSSYELLDIGDPTISAELPAEDVITANLAVLVNLGVKPATTEDDEPATPASEAGAPTEAAGAATTGGQMGTPAAGP